jgi:integrase
MFSMAVEDGHVTSNPALRILKRSRAAEGKQQDCIQPFTREEVSLLLETCREHYPGHYALVLLLVRAGLRIGEALALCWDDIDFNGRFAEVRQTWSNGRLATTKGNRRRRVDLSLHLTETLKTLLVERKKETLKNGWGEVPEWVFISHHGTRLFRWNFYERVWKKLLRKAGLRYIRIHDLRHTFASLLIQNGAPLAYVKEQLGHSSIQITVDTYGHLVPGGNRSEVDRLDDPLPATIRNPDATTPHKAKG